MLRPLSPAQAPRMAFEERLLQTCYVTGFLMVLVGLFICAIFAGPAAQFLLPLGTVLHAFDGMRVIQGGLLILAGLMLSSWAQVNLGGDVFDFD